MRLYSVYSSRSLGRAQRNKISPPFLSHPHFRPPTLSRAMCFLRLLVRPRADARFRYSFAIAIRIPLLFVGDSICKIGSSLKPVRLQQQISIVSNLPVRLLIAQDNQYRNRL